MYKGKLTEKELAELLGNIKKTGIFVTCGRATPNVMVAHFGTVGKLWGRDVFLLPVKSSKYSYQIITQTKSFALNVPARDMRDEISRCDVTSGFKCNKFEELGLHPKRARSIESYVLGECGLIAECAVIGSVPPDAISLMTDDFPRDKLAHTLFIGEFIDCYRLR